MICLEHNAIAAREHERQQLAALMARYEQQHGAIQTQPTRIGTDKGGLNGKRWVDTVGQSPKRRAYPGRASQSPPASAACAAAT